MRFPLPCKLFLFVCFCLFTSPSFTQSSANYTATTGATASLAADKNGNAISFSGAPNLIGNNVTSSNSSLQSIGFDVVFMGKVYSHFYAGNDGQVGLAVGNSPATVLSATAANDLTRVVNYPPLAANEAPVLAPFWDDLRTARILTTVQSVVTGASPNRCRVVQWNAVINAGSTTGTNPADGLFQLRLYESGEIEYVYGKMSIGSSAGTVTASIGFTAGDADNRFIALQNLSTYSFTRTAASEPASQSLINSSVAQTIFSLSSTADGSRRFFLFTPAAPSGSFTSFSTASATLTSLTLSWADDFNNELGYAIYTSTDNVNFVLAGTVAANTHSFTATNLNPGTAYYFKVNAFTEGAFTAATLTASTNGCSMNGLYKVGPTGTFSTITEALDTLKKNGIGGPVVLELQATYTSSGEVFPVTFPVLSCADAAKTVTVRPEAGAANLAITSNITPATVLLSGAKYVQFDGRAGGAGTSRNLTISNYHPAGIAVSLANDASYNTFKYLRINGINTSETSGVVVIGGTTGTTGNDNNLIDSCDVYDGVSTPTNLVYALGTAGKPNDNNTVSNCNLYNFYNDAKGGNGILIDQNNQAWTISKNSLFSNGLRNNGAIGASPLGPDLMGINIITPNNGNHVIDGNYIGGTGPQCGGSKMAVHGNMYFTGIMTECGPAMPVQIKNNVVDNITYSAIRAQMSLTGILAISGLSCSVTIANNRIGSANDSSIVCNSGYTVENNDFIGIGIGNVPVAGTDNILVEQNTVNGIYAGSVAYGGNFGLYPFYIRSSKATVRYNLVGDTVKTNGIVNNTADDLEGIVYDNTFITSPSNVSIYGNRISGLTQNSTSPYARLHGIHLSGNTVGGTYNVAGNTLERFYSSSSCTSGWLAAANGIITELPGTDVSKNTIRHIYNQSNAGTGSSYSGIVCNNARSASGSFSVTGNLIHSIGRNGSVPVRIAGIEILNGTGYVSNNMVRLGIDSTGNGITTGHTIYGIAETMTNTAAHSVYHNSVYIGGTQVAGSSNATAAFFSADSGSQQTLKNNIFVNNRSNLSTGSPGTHYAVYFSSAVNTAAGINYNVYHAAGTNGVLGRMAATDYTALSGWKAGTSFDGNSMFHDPSFVNPTGSPNSFDLHLISPTVAEGTGTSDATAFDDFDGSNRALLTPVDIGADAGNFTLIDVLPPAISLPAPIASTGDLTDQTVVATITDIGAGVNNYTYNGRPKIWFRKKAGALVSNWASDYGTLQSGTTKNGQWSFTVSNSLLTLPVTYGDTIQYYFAAQDTASPPNVGIYPAAGASHFSVDSQVSAPTVPLWYRILPQLDTALLVGTGERYTSLTGAGGLFEAINTASGGLSGNTRVTVTSNLAETGTNVLKGNKLNGFSLRIRTNTAVTKVITGSNLPTALITLQGVKKFTVDGSVNNAGRFLRFVSTAASNANSTFVIENNCDSVEISNCQIEANVSDNNHVKGNVVVGAGTNTNVLIQNNSIRNPLGFAALTNNCVLSTSVANGLVIRKNELANFRNYGVNLYNVSDGAVVDSNSFYYNNDTLGFDAAITGISIRTNGYHVISNNFIGGSAGNAGGSPWVWGAVYGTWDPLTFTGISIQGTGATANSPSLIRNNVFRNIRTANYYTLSITGIYTGGNAEANITGNSIGHPTSANSIVNGSGNGSNVRTIGIHNESARRVSIQDNVIANISATYDSDNMGLLGIVNYPQGQVKSVISGNKIYSLTSNSSSQGLYLNYGRIMGIAAIDTKCIADISENLMYDLRLVNTTGTSVYAYAVRLTNNGRSGAESGSFKRNKIYNLTNLNSNGFVPQIFGVYAVDGNWNVENNQIAIDNGSNTTNANIYGIWNDNTDSSTKNFSYNSIYIGGTTVAGSYANAYCLLHGGNGLNKSRMRNNIFYMEKAPGGRNHASFATAVGNSGFDSTSSNYNLFVARDTAVAFQTSVTQPYSLGQWRNFTKGDKQSYAASALQLPSAQFFKDAAAGNLNINNADDKCWYVNGRGIPLAGISDDYESSGVRSTLVTNGPTDIGADEFNTATQPPPMRIQGNHLPGGTEVFVDNGKTVASITWGNTGALPALGDSRWYSGTWPNDTTNNGNVTNARFMSGYWHIPATGGSNYSYSLKLYYDSSMLGKVLSETSMVVNKRQTNVPGSWRVITPTAVDAVLKTLTISNQTGFSEFTGTDVNATLPVVLTSFKAVAVAEDVQVTWQVASETAHRYYEIEKSYDAVSFFVVNRIYGRYANTNGGYDFTDTKALSANRTLYYRLKMVGVDGTAGYSNVARVNVQQTQSFITAVSPTIFTGEFTVAGYFQKAQKLTLQLVDVRGRMLYKKEIEAAAGNQRFLLDRLNFIGKGLYLLQIDGLDINHRQWLMKQ